jgi:hypothetical protein
MLSNNSPFKVFSRALIDGVFNLSHGGEFTPPTPPIGFQFLIDDAHNYLLDNAGNFLVVDTIYDIVDSVGNHLIDNSGNFLITQQ